MDEKELFSYLAESTKPLYLYGTGDGADKVLRILGHYAIPVTGIAVSDERHMNGQVFAGFDVIKLSGIPENTVVLVAFGGGGELLAEVRKFAAITDSGGGIAREVYIPDMPVVGDPVTERLGIAYSGIEDKTGTEITETANPQAVPTAPQISVPTAPQAVSTAPQISVPTASVAPAALFTAADRLALREKLAKVRTLLADDISRELFDNWLKFRVTGKLGCLPRPENGQADSLTFLKADKSTSATEHFVDAGAYDGDTAEAFIQRTDADKDGNFGKITLIEPDKDAVIRMKRRLFRYLYRHEKVQPVWAAAYDSDDTEMSFCGGGGRGGRLVFDGDVLHTKRRKIYNVKTVTIDKLCGDDGALPPTIIKYDVEGAEAAAIRGSARVIAAHSPRLQIAAYHRAFDIADIPLLVRGINRRYKVYLRCSEECFPPWEMNYFFMV